MTLPEIIQTQIQGKTGHTERIGMSGSSVTVYDDCVLKIEDCNPFTEENILAMQWLHNRIPSPKVIAHVQEDGKSFLLMSRIPGKMSCSPEYLEAPEQLLTALACGMHRLWQADPTGCPRDRTLPQLLKMARYRVENRLVDTDNVEPETFGPDRFRDPKALLQWLEDNTVASVPVLTHGDYCLPNIFMENGLFSGFVDVGDTGIGEKWRDIALCWRSLRDNYNGSHGGKVYSDFDPDCLFSYLDIVPDWDQIRYHLLLDELF